MKNVIFLNFFEPAKGGPHKERFIMNYTYLYIFVYTVFGNQVNIGKGTSPSLFVDASSRAPFSKVLQP